MFKRSTYLVIGAALLVASCQTQQELVQGMQSEAQHVAQRRGMFEMGCQQATATVLSNEMIQPPVINPRWPPPQRAEYTVGVEGCGKKATYLVVCAVDGTGCFASGTQNVIR